MKAFTQNDKSMEILGNFYETLKTVRIVEDYVPEKSLTGFFIKDSSEFLKFEFISEANYYLGLPEAAVNDIAGLVDKIYASGELIKFVQYCYLRVYHMEEYDEKRILAPKRLREVLGEQADLLPVLILISGIHGTINYYKAKGIKHEILTDTLGTLKDFMCSFKSQYGYWGIDDFKWLTHFFYGRIFRIGRLNFYPKYFEGNFIVYRNNNTGRVCALSEPNITYMSDGRVMGTNGVFNTENSFETVHEENVNYICGNPILPSGHVINKEVKLLTTEWSRGMSRGDIVLDVHIPGGTKLDNEECRKAFVDAIYFHKTYFGYQECRGFVCESWLLDPQMQRLLPKTSNIYRFQREFYLYPVLSDEMQTFQNLFGTGDTDLNKVKVFTSLQAAVADYLKKGNHMCMGGMFILENDLKNWGSEFYQKDFRWMLDGSNY